MKKMFHAVLSVVFAVVAFAGAAFAQTYPYNNPTYIPNAVAAQQTLAASGVANSAITLNGSGTLGVQFGGSCPNMFAKAEVSNDGSAYSMINLYSAIAAPASWVSTTGMYTANVAGYSYARINNAGSSGVACTINMVASPLSFTLPR